MTRHEIITELTRILVDRFDVDDDADISPAERLEKLGLEIPHQIDFLSQVEKHFNIRILPSEHAKIRTFGDVVALVEAKKCA